MINVNKNSKKTLTAVAVTIVVILLIIGVGVASWHLSAHMNRETEKIDSYSIREEIIPIAQLSTYDYCFTQVLFYTSTNNDNPFRLDIPFSENKYIATIDGQATIFVDAEKITFDPHYNMSNLLADIDIYIPHSEIKQPVMLDHESLKELENRDGFLNEFTEANFNDLFIETNQVQVQKIQESGLLQKSDERVQALISTQLRSIYGQDLGINYYFIDETEEQPTEGLE